MEIEESWQYRRGTYEFIPLSSLPLVLNVPILLAVSCTIYSAGRLAGRFIGGLYKLAGPQQGSPGPE